MHRNRTSNDTVSSSSSAADNSTNSTTPAAPVSLDEAIGLLKDRQNATNALNHLLKQEMNDNKVCESYHAFRVRYLRALGKLHPVGYEEPVGCNNVAASLQTLRAKERLKKVRYQQLKEAWVFYDSVAMDKPEVLSAEDQKIEKELDDIEQEIHEEWQNFCRDVITRAENNDNGNGNDAEINEWRLDLKELKKDLKHLKLRKSERDEFRKRAEMRRIKDIVRARRSSSSGTGTSSEETDDDSCDSDGCLSIDDGTTEGGSRRSSRRRKKKKDKSSSSSKENKDNKRRRKRDKLKRRKSKDNGFESDDGSNELLEEVFPPHIAKALREGRKVEPESKEMVTIFFSDIVGFTNISATISPLKVSQMLDRLYQKFDHLSREHDVYKVETIGDSWMGVTNLTKDQPDHAQRIAHFALDALKAAQSTFIDEDNYNLGKLNLRVGFHSGPVVANVVGSRNPRYCLFGDTVNTASRMESHSKHGMIQCSDASAEILKEAVGSGLRLVSRGQIEIKGKGLMETFFVEDEFAESIAANEVTASLGKIQAPPQLTQPPPPLVPAHQVSPDSRTGSDKTEEPPDSDSFDKDDGEDGDAIVQTRRRGQSRKSSFGKLKFWKRNNNESNDETKKSSGLFGKSRKSSNNRRASLDAVSQAFEPVRPPPNRRASLGSHPRRPSPGVPQTSRTPKEKKQSTTVSPESARPRQRPLGVAQSQLIGRAEASRVPRPILQASSPHPTVLNSPRRFVRPTAPTPSSSSSSRGSSRGGRTQVPTPDIAATPSSPRRGAKAKAPTPSISTSLQNSQANVPSLDHANAPVSSANEIRPRVPTPSSSGASKASCKEEKHNISKETTQVPSFPGVDVQPRPVTQSIPESQAETTVPAKQASPKTNPKINKFLARSIDSLRESSNLSSPENVINRLNEIYEMVKSSHARRDEFGTGGGIALFTCVVKRYQDETSVLEAAFRLMSVLSQGDANRDELVQQKSIQLVLGTMTKSPGCVAIHQWGCESLAGFAKTAAYQDEIVEHDGLDVIMATQKKHEAQGEVQVACFRALRFLAKHHQENAFNIAANGGIWAIMGVLQSKSFPLATVIDLHVEAFRAMAELARESESNRGSLATAGGVPKLIGAMSCFTRNANLVEAGTDALHCMSIEHTQNCDTIVAYDGIKTVVKFMQQHKKHAGVQEKGVWLLLDLMKNSSTAQFRIPDDCIKTIEEAVEKFPDHENLKEEGKELLFQLDPSRA